MKKKQPKIKSNNIRMSEDIAEAMKNVATVERKQIGVVWEEAARMFLSQRLGEEIAR